RYSAREQSCAGSTAAAAAARGDASQAPPGSTASRASTGNTAKYSKRTGLAPACSGCPADTVKAAGTGCTDDGNPCTTEVCNGTVGAPACLHNPGNAGTVCRAAASGGCDVAETCTGSSSTCPADAFQPSTVVWRAAAVGSH